MFEYARAPEEEPMSNHQLPNGWVAQPACRRIEGARSYEFHRAYSPENCLDEGRSYWLVAEPNAQGEPKLTSLSLDEARRAHPELAYGEFSSSLTAGARVDAWLAELASGAARH